ncbi:MAG: prolipoprotein diacylglyceryl transferase family protein [Planctomycetota bacterium]
MFRTLFLIPHEFAGIPIFGAGWLLMAIAIAFVIRLGWAARKGHAGDVLKIEGTMWLIAAALVLLVLPRVELNNVDGDPVGVALRGYGFFLLLGVVSAVAAACYRAKQAGLNPDLILGLAPWTFCGGLIGARLFYVIQYWETYAAESWTETLGNAFAFTGGGLVVYGGFVGGFLASCFFLLRQRLPLLRLGDVIVPCIFIGLMFGRLGCLMNGCCYGGRCDPGSTSIEFPPGSAVYQDQLLSGELVGLDVDKDQNIIAVSSNSLAEKAGIETGQTLDRLSLDSSFSYQSPKNVPEDEALVGLALMVDGQVHLWSPQQLPDRALPVRATQVISSATGAAMAMLLWGLGWIWKRQAGYRDGFLMLVGFSSYAVVRFILEWVRVDESGQFGTSFSISQWVSIAVLALSIAGLGWVRKRRPPAVANQSPP